MAMSYLPIKALEFIHVSTALSYVSVIDKKTQRINRCATELNQNIIRYLPANTSVMNSYYTLSKLYTSLYIFEPTKHQ